MDAPHIISIQKYILKTKSIMQERHQRNLCIRNPIYWLMLQKMGLFFHIQTTKEKNSSIAGCM